MSITNKDLGDSLKKPPQSYWLASAGQTSFPKLERDIDVDVAIVGGGLAGITCALLLKRENLKVAVLEADRIGQGTTGHTTAKITSQHSLIYYKIKQALGEELARQYADANETAIRTIAGLVEELNIDCDFVRQPAYVFTQQEQYIQKIQDEAETAKKLGIVASYMDTIPLSLQAKAAVRFDNQAQFHPRKYLLALAAQIEGDGSYIFEHTRMVDLEEGQSCTVISEASNKVTARYVIIASHFPFYDGKGMYFARLHPERSYALGVKVKQKYPGGMYITAEDPGRSIRSQKVEDGEMLIVGGEHHKTGHGENLRNHYKVLLDFADATFQVEQLRYRWSTQDYGTLDDVPYAGRLTSKTPNIFVATGFYKWGMTNSTASASIIRDLIVRGSSLWADVYDPSRKDIAASAKTFVKENADVAVSLASGKLQPPEKALEDIKAGKAAVVAIDGQKMGAYRDEENNLHVIDTTCTHMGCEVKWNDAERTWDCPCHGSRFTYEGEIVEGPAHKKLKHSGEGKNDIDPNIFN